MPGGFTANVLLHLALPVTIPTTHNLPPFLDHSLSHLPQPLMFGTSWQDHRDLAENATDEAAVTQILMPLMYQIVPIELEDGLALPATNLLHDFEMELKQHANGLFHPSFSQTRQKPQENDDAQEARDKKRVSSLLLLCSDHH